MLGQRLAGVFAEAMHGVEDTIGNAGLVGEANQQVGRDGGPFRRLVHHGAAGGERRRDLPGREHERGVPRRNHANRADRHPGGDVPVLFARQVLAVARLGGAVGEEPEIFRGADRGLGHETMGLAGVDAFQHRDIVGMGFDGIGHLVQQFLARRRRHVAPGLESPFGRLRRCIDVRGTAARDGGELFVIDRRVGLERFAGLCDNDLAVNEVPDAVSAQLCQQRLGAVHICREHGGRVGGRFCHGRRILQSALALR